MTEIGAKASNALGGKTARPCDSCLLKRARWFCIADDAFLCQACDLLVHSANQLASRHERVRLETSSFKLARSLEVIKNSSSSSPPSSASWHKGFTRKPRTPRQAKPTKLLEPPPKPSHHHALPLVPEINEDPNFLEENDEGQLLCRVPVFDPFGDGFCNETVAKLEEEEDGNIMLFEDNIRDNLNIEELLLGGCCDEELADFAADVESLLGSGIHEDDHKKLPRMIDQCEGTDGHRVVKVEDTNDDEEEDEVHAVIACQFDDTTLDMDQLNWDDFDYWSSSMSAGEEMKVDTIETLTNSNNDNNIIDESVQVEKKRMLLRLNYEAVIAAWGTTTQGSPWTNGIRPHQFNLDEIRGACLGGGSHTLGGRWGAINDAGREARVSRYREKRRTRLFSKKIRYQVRKLNAEKRPRMKGRFVKRTTNFSGSSLPNYLMNN